MCYVLGYMGLWDMATMDFNCPDESSVLRGKKGERVKGVEGFMVYKPLL
jgi:hypothetical protein